jgi:protein-L-isoaspartate(D-aspartate) O-methyltransferase
MTKPGRFPLPLDRVQRRAGATGAGPLRPQRPVHDAAQDAARRVTPHGLGLDSAAVRQRMVERLRASGIQCEPVLQAFGQVPRHAFVDTALANQAYEDTSLPIGLSQTISKPSVVARMLALLFDGALARSRGSLGRTLEIGTGCGYQTALLALLARSVVSVERLQPLHEKARGNLAGHRGSHVRLVWADGMKGHPPNAPYDSIVSAAGGESMPDAWLDQLAVGGRLVAPLHHDASGGQVLVVVDRTEHGLERRLHEAVHFVPLKSGTA